MAYVAKFISFAFKRRGMLKWLLFFFPLLSMPSAQKHFDRMNELANTREFSLQDACNRLRTTEEIAEYKEEYRKALSVLLEREVTISEAENLILCALPGGASSAWISETINESVRREDESRAVMLNRELGRETVGKLA